MREFARRVHERTDVVHGQRPPVHRVRPEIMRVARRYDHRDDHRRTDREQDESPVGLDACVGRDERPRGRRDQDEHESGQADDARPADHDRRLRRDRQQECRADHGDARYAVLRAYTDTAGLMLALRWKMLSGSYCALICASRSYFAAPYDARTRVSSPVSTMKFT